MMCATMWYKNQRITFSQKNRNIHGHHQDKIISDFFRGNARLWRNGCRDIFSGMPGCPSWHRLFQKRKLHLLDSFLWTSGYRIICPLHFAFGGHIHFIDFTCCFSRVFWTPIQTTSNPLLDHFNYLLKLWTSGKRSHGTVRFTYERLAEGIRIHFK